MCVNIDKDVSCTKRITGTIGTDLVITPTYLQVTNRYGRLWDKLWVGDWELENLQVRRGGRFQGTLTEHNRAAKLILEYIVVERPRSRYALQDRLLVLVRDKLSNPGIPKHLINNRLTSLRKHGYVNDCLPSEQGLSWYAQRAARSLLLYRKDIGDASQ